MTNITFKRELAEKMAQGIIYALSQPCTKLELKKHVARLERLVAANQVSITQLKDGLKAIAGNTYLSSKVKNAAIDKFNTIDKDIPNTNKEIPFIPQADIDKAIQTHSPSKQTFNFANITIPNHLFVDKESYGWGQLQDELLVKLYGQLGIVDNVIKLQPETTKCCLHSLPWYQNAVLLRLSDSTWLPQELSLYYLVFKEQLARLSGTSPVIHMINEEAPIKITEDNAADYLKWFCFFVHGEEGPFYVIESVDDLLLPDNLPPDQRAILVKVAQPIENTGMNEHGHYLFSATVFYSNALFQADFAVHPSGMVEMLDDEPIAADLPIRIKVILGK